MANPTNTSLNHNGGSDLVTTAHRLSVEVALTMMDDGDTANISEFRKQLFTLLRLFAPQVFDHEVRQ
jgi:hypothetical protein